MKRNITKHSLSVTLTLVTDIVEESNSVSSPFGPVRAGLITSQTTLPLPLMELLNSLVKQVENLPSKSYTGYDTLRKDTVTLRALHFTTAIEQGGINENWS